MTRPEDVLRSALAQRADGGPSGESLLAGVKAQSRRRAARRRAGLTAALAAVVVAGAVAAITPPGQDALIAGGPRAGASPSADALGRAVAAALGATATVTKVETLPPGRVTDVDDVLAGKVRVWGDAVTIRSTRGTADAFFFVRVQQARPIASQAQARAYASNQGRSPLTLDTSASSGGAVFVALDGAAGVRGATLAPDGAAATIRAEWVGGPRPFDAVDAVRDALEAASGAPR